AHAFDHAPVEVTLSVLLAITFSYMVSSDAEPFREWLELAVIIVLAGAAACVATLLHALGAWSTRTRWLVTTGGAAAAAVYGVFMLDFQLAAEAWRAAALIAAGVLLVLASPALAGRAGATERFRLVAGRLLVRSLAVLLYATALYAGLALALGAVNTLFELHLDGRIYAHALGWVFFVLVSWVVAGGLTDYVRAAESPGPVAEAVHRMSAFLVTPLLAIYYAILYAYAVRIAITGELPKNLVSPLVIAAGLIAGTALVLFDRPADDRGSFRSLRIAAPLFVPLSVLGLWALGMRLGQYGWTEFRGLRTVLLCTLGVLAVAMTMAVRRRSLHLHLFPLVLAVVTALSVVGPWSVIAGSRRSQQARLAAAMSDAGIDGNASAVRDTLIANEPFEEISETTRYLLSHFGPGALPPLFAQHAEGTARVVDVVQAAGLRPARPDPGSRRGGYAQLTAGAVFDDGAGGTLHYVRIERSAPVESAPPTAAAPITAPDALQADTPEALTVRIPVAGMNLLADLAEIRRALTNAPERVLSPESARVTLRDETGRVRGELIVLEIGIGGERGARVHRLVGIVRLPAE
ncbi:MAG: DUF4153 domain-containing protein, partial [Longimicrobiales bacterium]